MKSLNEDIKKNQFRRLYLLYGDENYLKRQYKWKLKRALIPEEDSMNYHYLDGKGIDLKQVIDQAETMPFFAEHRVFVIENSGLFKNASADWAEYLAQAPDFSVFIFSENEVDKRNKLYKLVKDQGRVTEFARQNERVLSTWIVSTLKKDDVKITGDALQLFLEKTGVDMENISRELEKLTCYVWKTKQISAEDVEEICTVQTVNKIFEMIRAIGEKRQKKALELYYDLLSLKEPPMRILFLIARQFQQLLLIQSLRSEGFDTDTIASKAGLQRFIVRNGLQQAANFSMETLEQAVQECVQLETDVKTGRMNDRMSVEILIVKYSSKEMNK